MRIIIPTYNPQQWIFACRETTSSKPNYTLELLTTEEVGQLLGGN